MRAINCALAIVAVVLGCCILGCHDVAAFVIVSHVNMSSAVCSCANAALVAAICSYLLSAMQSLRVRCGNGGAGLGELFDVLSVRTLLWL